MAVDSAMMRPLVLIVFTLLKLSEAANNCTVDDNCRYCRDGAIVVEDPQDPSKLVHGGGHCVLNSNNVCVDIYTHTPCSGDASTCPSNALSNVMPEYLQPAWYQTCGDQKRKYVMGPAGCKGGVDSIGTCTPQYGITTTTTTITTTTKTTQNTTTTSNSTTKTTKTTTTSTTQAIPDDYTSWLSSDPAKITLSGNVVTAVTDRNPLSTIAVIGSPTFNTIDGFHLHGNNVFQLNNVIGFGTWTVFLVFKATNGQATLFGADPGGCGDVDTEIGLGSGGNRWFLSNDGVQSGEIAIVTHSYMDGGSCADAGLNGGVFTSGSQYNDGNWHWGEFYGGADPKYRIVMNDGTTVESTNVYAGWMRNGLASYVGRAQDTGDAYFKEVIVYNRALTDSERAVIHGFLNQALIGDPWA